MDFTSKEWQLLEKLLSHKINGTRNEIIRKTFPKESTRLCYKFFDKLIKLKCLELNGYEKQWCGRNFRYYKLNNRTLKKILKSQTAFRVIAKKYWELQQF